MHNTKTNMATTLVIGSQWGDEGKGKIIDYLAKQAHYVVRYHGGNNAGHTVMNDFGKFGMHLIPSGVFHKKSKVVIANGAVLDLEVLIDEIETLQKSGIILKDRMFISPRCHVIMPYHKLLDRLFEDAKGDDKTGTTGRGIGPVYADKVSYNGIRLADLLNKDYFSQKLEVQLLIKNKILKAFGQKPLDKNSITDQYTEYMKALVPFITETYTLLKKALKDKKNILLEGAHGMFLDTDWGTYPFVTASTVVSGGVTQGTGIPPHAIKTIIGVVKAYTTRVGAGPFPTELLDQIGDKLRKEGNEFGTTTGRPRRCGWFDAELVQFAAEINGFTDLAITKLDVLDSFKDIKICTGYSYKGKPVSYIDGDARFLTQVKPVYKSVKGWLSSTKGIKTYADLPKEAKNYLSEIQKLVGIKISYISTGSNTDEIIKI